jgi:hypothetical protein
VIQVPARRLLVIVGWLVTPLLVWAAAFLGGWLGARVGGLFESAKLGFAALVAGASLGALLATAFCLWTMRKASVRSRKPTAGHNEAGSASGGESPGDGSSAEGL